MRCLVHDLLTSQQDRVGIKIKVNISGLDCNSLIIGLIMIMIRIGTRNRTRFRSRIYAWLSETVPVFYLRQSAKHLLRAWRLHIVLDPPPPCQ